MAISTRERRIRGRGHWRFYWDVLFRFLRLIAIHAQNIYATLGLFVLAGIVVVGLGTYGFAELAHHVREGSTQAFDYAVLRFLGAHRIPLIEDVLLEVTALGTGLV